MADYAEKPLYAGLLSIFNNSSNNLEQVHVSLSAHELYVQQRDIPSEGSLSSGDYTPTSPRTAFGPRGGEALTLEPPDTAEPAPIRTVLLRPEGPSGPGLSITGGEEYDLPIIISKIFPGGAADRCGDIHEGDKIISVNGTNVEAVNHRRAVELLKADTVKLELQMFRRASHGSSSTVGSPPSHFVGSSTAARHALGIRPPDRWATRVKTIPLKQAAVSLRMAGTAKLRPNSFQVTSADGQDSITLYCSNTAEVVQWSALVRTRILSIDRQLLTELNASLTPHEKVIHRGWVAMRRSSTEQWKNYVPQYLVLRSNHVYLFDSPPSSPADLSQTVPSYPIVTSHCCEVQAERLLDDWPYCFCITTANGEEIYLAAESQLELAKWIQVLRQATVEAALDGVMVFKGLWSRKSVELTISLQGQLTLVDGQDKSTILRKPFAQLVKTATDDSSVSLSFTDATAGPDAEAEIFKIRFQAGNVGVVNVIHNMMLAAVATLDPTILKETELI